MHNSNRIAMIVEGGSFEGKVLRNIKRSITRDNAEYVFIILPVNSNIYVLWKALKDDRDLDIIEVIREKSSYARKMLEGMDRDSFSEIYLFFDFDSHQNNLKTNEDPDAIIQSMIDLFDNETENGKLYISYPMAEAVRDFISGSCRTTTDNCYYMSPGREYKSLTGDNNPFVHIGTYTRETWAEIINSYRGRLSCMFKHNKLMQISECKRIDERTLYELQMNLVDEGIGACVISAFPRLIIDYYDSGFISELVQNSRADYIKCNPRRYAGTT